MVNIWFDYESTMEYKQHYPVVVRSLTSGSIYFNEIDDMLTPSQKFCDRFRCFRDANYQYDDKSGCTVYFVSADQIKKYEMTDSINQKQLAEEILCLISDLFELLGMENNYCQHPSDYSRHIQILLEPLPEWLIRLRKLISCHEVDEYEEPQSELRDILELLERSLSKINRIVWGDLRSDDEHKTFKKIQIKLGELIQKLKLFRFPITLYGCYLPRTKTIYICLENIHKEADKRLRNNTEFFVDLAQSVLVHEITHYLHHCILRQRQRRTKDEARAVRKSAVMETVAETVQYLFAQDMTLDGAPLSSTIHTALTQWMNNHSKRGGFPAWGYAGESILRIVCTEHSFDETQLLNQLVEISRDDWEKAYAYIESLALLNKLKK